MKKDNAFSIMSLMLFVCLTFLIGELVVRTLSVDSYITPKKLEEERLHYDSSLFARNVLTPQERILKGNGNSVWYINEKGYRGSNFSIEKPRGVIRIIFYGSSTTFGMGPETGIDWPHRVEEILNSKNLNVEIINAGVPDHASFDSLGRFLTEGHLFAPDIVVFNHAWNDIKYFHTNTPLLRLLKPRDPNTDPRVNYQGAFDQFMTEHSCLYNLIRMELYAKRIKEETPVIIRPTETKIANNAVRQYQMNVETFVAAIQNIGAQPVLIIQPRLMTRSVLPKNKKLIKSQNDQVLTYNTTLDAFDMIDQILRSVAHKNNALLIDPSTLISGDSENFFDAIHFTALGSERFAFFVAAKLESLIRQP